MNHHFNKVLIIGVGQIGASIGLNLVGRRLASEVIGIGRSRANLRKAVQSRAIHRVGAIHELPLLGDKDLVILATPVRGIVEYLKILTRKPLVIDVGSTKAAIVKEGARRRLRFVGCHPIAGTEKGGAEAGDTKLFRGRLCLITPLPGGSRGDLQKVRGLWKSLGAQVVVMEARRHDRLFAAASHLPHVVAYALVTAVSGLIDLARDSRFVFSGFKGTTRIAASPAEMWRDIFLENRDFVLKGIDRLMKELRVMRSMIAKKNGRALGLYLNKAQVVRRRMD